MKNVAKKALTLLIAVVMLCSMFTSVSATVTPASLVGSYLKLGTFNGEDMVFYVAARDDMNADGAADYYLISANSIMAAPLSNIGDELAADASTANANQARAHSGWPYATIRTWLNSADTEVVYDDSYASRIVDEQYADKAGFITNFTPEEQSLIMTVPVKSNASAWNMAWNNPYSVANAGGDAEKWTWAGEVQTGNAPSDWNEYYADGRIMGSEWRWMNFYSNTQGSTINGNYHAETMKFLTEDKIFLPSIIDLYKYKIPLHKIVPIGSGAWLRDTGFGCQDYNYFMANALFASEYASYITAVSPDCDAAIYPAMYIDGAANLEFNGAGTKENPYSIVWEKDASDLTGKFIYFGEYGDTYDGNTAPAPKSPIKWYVAGKNDINADGQEEYYLLAAQAISVRPMGATVSGDWGHNDYQSWPSMPLRAWLNSDEEKVSAYGKKFSGGEYVDAAAGSGNLIVLAPNAANGLTGRTYENEPGFLTNFTDAEKAKIVPVTHKSLVSFGAESYKGQTANIGGFNVGGDIEWKEVNYNWNESAVNWNVSPYKGVWSGMTDKNNTEYWKDAISNINGMPGNNFNTADYGKSARYVETTDTVFVPSLFDVAMYDLPIEDYKEANVPGKNTQCGATYVNTWDEGIVWTRDFPYSSGLNTWGFKSSVYTLGFYPSSGMAAYTYNCELGVQPAMYIAGDIEVVGNGTFENPANVIMPGTYGGVISTAVDEETATITADVYNATEGEKAFTLIVAEYNATTNQLENVAYLSPEKKITDGSDTITYTVNITDKKIKAFLWDLNTLTPYDVDSVN